MNKLERLLSIIIYLLNHGRVSSSFLAEKYEVSIRTILRDMDTLTLAGIPIIAYTGVLGGYEIMEEYRMSVQLANKKDYEVIYLAMQALQSAFQESQIQATYEKIKSLPMHQETGHMLLDFSVLKEQEKVNEYILCLQNCISKRKCVSFHYTNAKGESTRKQVEPLAVIYQWYAWYLIGYDVLKEDVRYYKVIRMDDVLQEKASIKHGDVDLDNFIKETKQQSIRAYYDILVYCKEGCQLSYAEYLNGTIIETFANGDYTMRFHLPKDEELWKGTLLAYAKDIKIVEPDEVREELKQRCFAYLKRNSDIELS